MVFLSSEYLIFFSVRLRHPADPRHIRKYRQTSFFVFINSRRAVREESPVMGSVIHAHDNDISNVTISVIARAIAELSLCSVRSAIELSSASNSMHGV
jgi:hypothetical protein